jgi:hypothetical protein
MSMVGNIALKIISDRADLPVFAGASGRLQIRIRGSLPGLDDGLVNGRCSGHELSLGVLSAGYFFPSMAHSGTALAARLNELTHHHILHRNPMRPFFRKPTRRATTTIRATALRRKISLRKGTPCTKLGTQATAEAASAPTPLATTLTSVHRAPTRRALPAGEPELE